MAKIYGHDKVVNNAIDSLVEWVGEDDTGNQREIGKVSTENASLITWKDSEGCYKWMLEGYRGYTDEEIPQYLYDALNRFQDEQEAKK